MFRFLILIALVAMAIPATAAPPLAGLWLTQDRGGVVRVSPCDGGLCAELTGIVLDRPGDRTPVDYRGVSQCHLQLISDAKPVRANLWKGHIVDPRNGSIYGVELHLDPHGNLALRGFVGVPLLGQTQTWTRYVGTVPDDCRLMSGTAVAGTSSSRSGRPR